MSEEMQKIADERSARRVMSEYWVCVGVIDEGIILECVFPEDKQSMIITFSGPSGTKYESEKYTIKWRVQRDYPFKRPDLFWVGKAPDHKFYRWDHDDEYRVTRCTNIGNHGCGGIFHDTWSPQLTVLDFIKQIRHSLTPAGEKEMEYYMDSH